MTGVPDDVLREKIIFIEEFREFTLGGCTHSSGKTIRLWDRVGIPLSSLKVKSQVK